MKTYSVISAVAAALAGVLAIGGCCIPPSQYNEALALNGKMQRKLEDADKRILALEEEKSALEASLEDQGSEGAERQKEIDNLNQANADLHNALEAVLAKYKAQGKELEDLRNQGGALPEPVDKALSTLATAHPELIEYLPKYGMLKIKSDLTFASGSVKVKAGAITALKKLAEILNTPDAAKFHLYVAGHTDDQPLVRTKPIYGTNWRLSARRAIAVIEVLFGAGIEQPRMAAVAFSKHHPIAPNKPDNKGNPLNRRVELWLVPPDRLLTQQAPEGDAVEGK